MTQIPKKKEKNDDELSSCTSDEDEIMDDDEQGGGEEADDDDEDEEENEEGGEINVDDDDDGEAQMGEDVEAGAVSKEKEVYIPGRSALAEDEELVMDKSAYEVYQHATTAAPCLSFCVLRDHLGDNRGDVYPLTAYLVAGTQAESHSQNNLLCMKMWNMHRISANASADDSEDEDDDDDDPEDNDAGVSKKPKLNVVHVPHHGAVNRVRVQDLNERRICASWSENKSVYLTDLTDALKASERQELVSQFVKNKMAPQPFFKFTGHAAEGFGMDWSPVTAGLLATGDCAKNIHVWRPTEGGKWDVDRRPLVGHTKSVEDIQWSPNEPTVLTSCSVDRTIRVFDIRANPASACMLTVENAHASDVNVISWNRLEQAFLLSGGDDGALKVWDFRQFKSGKPVSTFTHHKAPITSVEWHPSDSSVFTASSEDDCVTLWDLGVEKENVETEDAALKELPSQLLFIHQGQQEVKECHWHPQMPGLLLSTAQSGFNVFRTISV